MAKQPRQFKTDEELTVEEIIARKAGNGYPETDDFREWKARGGANEGKPAGSADAGLGAGRGAGLESMTAADHFKSIRRTRDN